MRRGQEDAAGSQAQQGAPKEPAGANFRVEHYEHEQVGGSTGLSCHAQQRICGQAEAGAEAKQGQGGCQGANAKPAAD